MFIIHWRFLSPSEDIARLSLSRFEECEKYGSGINITLRLKNEMILMMRFERKRERE